MTRVTLSKIFGAMTTTEELLLRVPFLAALEPSDRSQLAAAARPRSFRKGEVIFYRDDPGESLFLIAGGSVRIYLPSPQGTDLTLAVLGPGDFFGDLALLDGRGPRSASAMALRDTETLVVDRADFLNVIRSRPEAAILVLEVIAGRLRVADEMAGDLAFLGVSTRLAKKLLELAAAHGVPRAGGLLLDVRLTQEELANMVGVTRESVNRHLSLFKRLGFLSNQGRRFVIRDADALREYVSA